MEKKDKNLPVVNMGQKPPFFYKHSAWVLGRVLETFLLNNER